MTIGLLSVLVLFVVGAWTRLWDPEATESALMAFFIVNRIVGLGALIGPSDLPREPRAILRIALGSIAVFTMLYCSHPGSPRDTSCRHCPSCCCSPSTSWTG